MISFNRPADILPSILILLSLLVLAGTLIYTIAVPLPSTAGMVAARLRSKRMVSKEITQATLQRGRATQAVRARVWTGDPEAITATVLAQLTEQTIHQGLKLTSFRPDRALLLGDITELQYNAQITGSYAQVHSVMSSLDANHKLVLRSVQLITSEKGVGEVSATFGLAVFVASSPSLTADIAAGGNANG